MRSKSLAVVFCLVIAFFGALGVRYYDRLAATKSAPLAPGVKTAAEILALIPEQAGDSLTDKAIAGARAKFAKGGESARSWVTLGDALMQKARDAADETYYGPAELSYERALSLDPRSVEATAGMAWVKGDRHLFDESVTWGRKALALDPNNAAAYGIIGDADLQLGNYDAAFDDYQKMVDLRPDISSYSRSAYLLWVTGNLQKAIFTMGQAIRAGAPYAENTAWCRSRLALMLFNDGAYIPAEQAIAPSLEAAPRNVNVLLVAAKIKTALGDHAAAKELYQRVLTVAPNIEAIGALGDLAAADGQPEEAEKYYRQVDDVHANYMAKRVHDHMLVARFYADHDRNLVEALRLAEQMKLTRNVFEADTLAWVYFKNGEIEKAREAMALALSQKTQDPIFQFHAGMMMAKVGERVDAQKFLYTAVSWSPKFSLHDAPLAYKEIAALPDLKNVATGPTPLP